MDYRQEYDKWCNDPYFDDQTREELKAIAGDDKEIEDRFYRTLEFGTAGLRGVIGAGTNRMNIYTVRQATQGLANYILAQGGQEKGVAIAHDSRLMADEFTDAAALCLAANGIKTYVFKSLRPVPELSFAVRTLGCIAGIVITASHNPREYNGYKVYWEDGAQVTPPHDTGIMAEVAKVTSFDMVKTMEKEKAQAEGLYQIISDDVDESYFAELRISRLFIHRYTEPVLVRSNVCCMIWDLKMYISSHSRQLPTDISRRLRIRTRRIRMHGNWHLSLQRKRMQIWFWQPIRMPTVWVYTARIRKAASM